MSKRNRLIQGLKLCVLPWVLGAALTATAQDFPPKKSITMVVGFAAGGGTDGDGAGAGRVRDRDGVADRRRAAEPPIAAVMSRAAGPQPG